MENKIWGLQFELVYRGEITDCRVFIDNTFYKDGKFWVGINSKFFKEMEARGVEKIIVNVKEKGDVMEFYTPNSQCLKEKRKAKEYEKRKSLFEGSKPMLIYFFQV